MDSIPPKYRYDAFISYSRRDVAFAKALETALEKFRLPKDVPARQRSLDVFRDESDFTGAAYYESIERHLQSSAMLIVICSPDAAQSEFVADEIRRFVGGDANRGHQIIPILYRGIPNNKAGPQQEEARAFPAALYEFLEMPLGIDYLGFDPARHKPNKGTYINSWYAILANICNVSRGEIEERERRRQSSKRRLRAVFVSAVLVVLSIALVITLVSRQQAVRERQIAEQRREEAVKSAEAERVAREEAQNQRGFAEQQTLVAESQRNLAVREQRLAESGQLSANALNLLAADPQLSLLLGFEAANLSYSANSTVSDEAQDALHRALQSSRERLRLAVNSEGVNAVTFSPDRRLIVTADSGGVKFWDTIQGTPLPIRLDGAGRVLGLAFSPDGNKLATAENDRTARIWDVKTGREQRVMRGHEGYVWSVAFSPDGSRVATASNDGTAKVWDAESGRELNTLIGHSRVLYAIAFSRDGKLLATGGSDYAQIWDAASGRLLHELSDEGTVHGVALSPDGRTLATVNFASPTVTIWDVNSGHKLRTLDGHTAAGFAVAFSPDGSKLATANMDKTVRLWNPVTGQALFVITGHNQSVDCVAFSNDGEQIATGGEDGTARIWRIQQPYEIPPLVGHTNTINQVVFSSDGTRMATAGSDNTVRVWLTSPGREQRALTLSAAINGVAFSPDGRRLASASSDGTGSVFDVESGAELFALNGHTDEVKSIAYSRDGLRMATGSFDGTARIWDAASGKELSIINAIVGQVDSVDLNRNATRLAIGIYSDDASGEGAQIWDTRSVRSDGALSRLDADHIWVKQVRFSPDGTRVATTGSSPPFLVHVWDTESGRKLFTLSGHTANVLTAAYSPDGSTLATGGSDSTVKLWDTARGRERFTLSTPNVTVNSVAFSPDGRRLASTGSDWKVQFFAIDPVDLMVLAASRLRRALTADECRLYLRRDNCSATASSRIIAGKELRTQGQTEAAMMQFVQAFSTFKATDPRSAAKRVFNELLMSEARDRVEVDDFAGAANDFRASIELVPLPGTEPDREVALWIAMEQVKKAKLLATAGKGAEEILLLQDAIALDPKNESAFVQLARAYYHKSEYHEAVVAMRSALKISPTVSNMNELADFLRLNKDFPEAIEVLKRAIAVDPRNELAHRYLGYVFRDTGDSEKALKEFNAAIAIEPTKYSYLGASAIYESHREFDNALEALKKAKEIDPTYVAAYRDTAGIYQDDLANFEAAYRELAAARKLAPNDVGLEADFAEACLTSGRFQEAIDEATDLLDSRFQSQGLSVSSQFAIKFVRVVALQLSGSAKLAGEEQHALIADFRALVKYEQSWTYTGTRRFITNYRMDPDQRSALLKLLDMLDSGADPQPKR
jgi:WD40 repeat protein/tetratricopeptide (TPR) repeat protein